MPYASRTSIKRARQLRSQQTDAELRHWWRLRDKQVSGYRFRRQVRIGPFFADFACLGERLVIEVDGGQHATDVDHDRQRTAYLQVNGFRVLRFWDNDVLTQTDAVVESIRQALTATQRSP